MADLLSSLNPDAAAGGVARRRAAADSRRRRIGQDAHADASRRAPDRHARRRAVAHPRRHLHQQGGGRDARAARAPARRARRCPGCRPSTPPACASCAARSRRSASPRTSSSTTTATRERLLKECLDVLRIPEQTLDPAPGRRADRRRQEQGPDAAGLRTRRRAARRSGAGLRALPGAAAARQRARLRRSAAHDACDCSTSAPDVLDRYRERFQHVLVDEYQDTNTVQYRLTNLLAVAPPQPVRGRRRRPVDLPLARRRDRQHPRLRARLSRRGRSSGWSRTTARPATSSPPPARWWRATRAARARRCGPRIRAATRWRSRRCPTISRRRASSRARSSGCSPARGRAATSPSSTAPTRSRARWKRRWCATASPT